MSVSDGWIWFIPLGPTRTSLGFVCPQEYYRQSGKTPDELYQDALAREPRISALVKNATCEGKLYTTKDWSFIAQRTYGQNWWLVGESAGFADPILSAGLTLTHTGARELAYIINAIDRGEHDAAWLRKHYDATQRSRVGQHIRFADYWYASNGQLVDLRAHCQQIAADSGLILSPEEAWRWLAQGGFSHDVLDKAAVGSFDVASMKHLTQMFADAPAKWQLSEVNVLHLNLAGAVEEQVPAFQDGKIRPITAYTRGSARLPMVGLYKAVVELVRRRSDVAGIYTDLVNAAKAQLPPDQAAVSIKQALQVIEVLLNQGFLTPSSDPKLPVLNISTKENQLIRPNQDPAPQAQSAGG
jgi:hypothetical protein